MSNRILIDAALGRVAISKPGFDVTSPSLPDSNKVFDSSWFFAGQLVMCRYVQISYPDNVAGTYDVMYPKPLNYAPAGMVYCVKMVLGAPQINPLVPSWYLGGRGYWSFLTDRARNIAHASVAQTIGYLVVAIGAA